jgi:plastocyanin
MRVLTPRFALGLGLFTALFALADIAQAGPFRRRAARRGAVATSVASVDPCCPQAAYGAQVYPGGVGYAMPMPGIQTAGYTPSGTIPAPLPSPFPTRSADTSLNATAISISDTAFEPVALTLQPGQTVKWTNNGKKPHTVTSDKGDWGSSELAPGQTFTATFTKVGEFSYYCKLHPDMKATISVK